MARCISSLNPVRAFRQLVVSITSHKLSLLPSASSKRMSKFKHAPRIAQLESSHTKQTTSLRLAAPTRKLAASKFGRLGPEVRAAPSCHRVASRELQFHLNAVDHPPCIQMTQSFAAYSCVCAHALVVVSSATVSSNDSIYLTPKRTCTLLCCRHVRKTRVQSF